MGKLQTFEILFDQDKTVYSSGDSVTGSVKVELSSSLLCKGKNLLTWRSSRPTRKWAPAEEQRFSRFDLSRFGRFCNLTESLRFQIHYNIPTVSVRSVQEIVVVFISANVDRCWKRAWMRLKSLCEGFLKGHLWFQLTNTECFTCVLVFSATLNADQ